MEVKKEDLDFRCSSLGVRYQDVAVIDDVIILSATSNIYILMNKNYDVFDMETASSIEEVGKRIQEKMDLYCKPLDVPYLEGFSLNEISELNRRISFMRYDRLRVNHTVYSLDKKSVYTKMFGLFKLVQFILNNYYRIMYPLVTVNFMKPDNPIELVRNTLGKIWALIENNPNITVGDIRNSLGYPFSTSIEDYLGLTIELFKTQSDDKIHDRLVKILDFPQDDEMIAKISHAPFMEFPSYWFGDLVKILESEEPKRS